MGLGVAVGEALALLLGAALALAEVADRGDEVALLVGEGEVHMSRTLTAERPTMRGREDSSPRPLPHYFLRPTASRYSFSKRASLVTAEVPLLAEVASSGRVELLGAALSLGVRPRRDRRPVERS